MTAEDWLDLFVKELGADAPSGGKIDSILELAAEAAHSSERTAAPVACWIGAQAGRPLEELIEVAKRIGDG